MVAAALAAALRARGDQVAVAKPVLTGTDDEPDADWPPDDALLAAAAGTSPDAVTGRRFGPAVSPHLAAELAGAPLEPAELVRAAVAAGEGADVLVVEGVGGLLVPLTPGYSIRDFARELGLPLVVAARPALGTINHTLLTLEAARAVALEPLAVVLTPWPDEPSAMERSNRATIERLGRVPTLTLPRLPRADPDLLAQAGAPLVETLDR